MSTPVRTRATVQLRETPNAGALFTESLGAGAAVDVLTDQGAWLELKSSHLTHAIPGWVPREALAFPPPERGIFPSLTLGSGKSIPTVSSSVKAADLNAWRNAPGKPGWIPTSEWDTVSAGDRQTVTEEMRVVIQDKQVEWDDWMATLAANGREADAKLGEWFAILEGGRNVWTLRPEMIYSQPAQNPGHEGWAVEADILLWTGQVRRNNQEPKYKTWYEVSLYKSGRLLKGWYKGDLLDEYVFPTAENDTGVESNRENQFDLSQPMLRHPADPEIADAIAADRTGFQYIDVVNALGVKKIHHNLCGEFCVAALAGVDVIPFLNQWKAVYPRVLDILRNNEGTGLQDAKSMFGVFNFDVEEYKYAPSIVPVSPLRLLERLREGKKAFAGVGIFKSNGKLCGKESGDKTTRHWVVLEDIIPVGNGGWVRLYNPFRNREEVYTYDLFIQSVGQFGIGLWVSPPSN